jgi:ABC-2 type transport system permease protein
MTTLQAPGRTALPGQQGPRAPWTGLLAAEWTKIRSVRSTVWSLLAFVIVAIGFSTLLALVVSNTWNHPGSSSGHAQILADPTGFIFGAGFGLGQLALGVLGVMPGRIPMLVAKVVVFGVLTLVVSAVTVFAVFFIGSTILHSHVVVTLSQPGVTRSVLGGIAYLTMVGLFAMAVGGLIRHTAGAIAAVVGLILVVPPLIGLIPGTIAAHVHAYLPTVAGSLIGQTAQQPGDLLSPWQGFGVFCAWTVVLLVACGWLLKERDA